MKKAITFNTKDSNRVVVIGELTGIAPVETENAKGIVLSIKLTEEENLKIGFFNNDKVNYTERATKSKLRNFIGKVIAVSYEDKNNGLRLGYNWNYVGSYCFLTKETIIYLVKVGKVKTGAKGQTVVSVPIRNGQETVWHTISLWDYEKFNLAQNAIKYLQTGDTVAIKAQKPKQLDDGREVTKGYSFNKIFLDTDNTDTEE